MKIVYCCPTGRHASLLTALLHLGVISSRDTAWMSTFREAMDQAPVDELDHKPWFVGKDDRGNEVYTLAVGNDGDVVFRFIKEILGLWGITLRDLYLADCWKDTSLLVAFGDFLEKQGFKGIGRTLQFKGLRDSFAKRQETATFIKRYLAGVFTA